MSLSEGQLRLGRCSSPNLNGRLTIAATLWCVTCDQLGVTGIKAPMVTGPFCGYRLPDFTIIANGRSYWDEVKYKTMPRGIAVLVWWSTASICRTGGIIWQSPRRAASTASSLLAMHTPEASSRPASNSWSLAPATITAMFGSRKVPSSGLFRTSPSGGSFDLKTGQMRFHFSDSPAMTRRVLPQRRRCETFEIAFGGLARSHVVTVGYYADGALGEVFINSGRSGEPFEAIARDGAVVLSLALQYGAELDNIRSAVTRDDQGAPTSVVGAVIDKLCEVKP